MFLDSDNNSNGYRISSFADGNFLNQTGPGSATGSFLSNELTQFAQDYTGIPSSSTYPPSSSPLISVAHKSVNGALTVGGCDNSDSAVNQAALNNNSYGWNICDMYDNIQLSAIESSLNNEIPYSSDMTCSEYVNVKSLLEQKLQYWNTQPVTHQYDRDLRDEYISLISTKIAEVNSYMDARDCDATGGSPIDTAQQQATQAQLQATQAQADLQAAQTQAQQDADKAAKDAQAELNRVQAEAAAETERLKKEQEEKDKRNKMIMIGGAVVLGFLLLRKK